MINTLGTGLAMGCGKVGGERTRTTLSKSRWIDTSLGGSLTLIHLD